MKRALLVIAAVALVVYFGDYLSVRLRIPNREPLATVQVFRDYAIKLKDKRVNYTPAYPDQQECTNSLFPHFGDQPCWYVYRHIHQHIDIDGSPAGPLIDTP